MLGKDLIDRPQQWQMVLEVSASALSVVAFSDYEEQALIAHTITFNAAAPTPLRALEDTIYDNPMLLLDFKRVIILYDTMRFLPVPEKAIKHPDMANALFRRVFPADTTITSGTTIVHTTLPRMNAAISFEMPNDVLNFLQRTFHNATIAHPLAPSAIYFQAKHPARCHGKMLVNLYGNRLDIIILGENAPLALNSFKIVEPLDAVYYIMSARANNALRDTDEIMIAGDRMARAAITPLLRRYVRYVMPAIFPSVMFRAGKASLGAPFETVLAPLVL